MISEGSCDTEDWSNDCWKFIFARNKIKFYLTIFHNITVFTVHLISFKSNPQSSQPPKFEYLQNTIYNTTLQALKPYNKVQLTVSF